MFSGCTKSYQVQGGVILPTLDDFLGKSTSLDTTDGTDEHFISNRLLDRLGKRSLVPRTSSNLLHLVNTTAGNIKDINSSLRQKVRKLDALVKSPVLSLVLRIVIQPVGGADTSEQRHIIRHHGHGGLDDLEGKSNSILEASTVFIAVSKMEVDDIKAGLDSSTYSGNKVLLKLLNFFNGDGPGNRITWSKWLVARANNIIRPPVSSVFSCKSSI
ncbi:hypothetical protein HG530_009242 [Fusarium avenaceum]|nr:hypothetical protein HG530_009242 [Fusarium avenaceum]